MDDGIMHKTIDRANFLKALGLGGATGLFATSVAPKPAHAAAGAALNVKDFGAVADGSTDDAPAFQRALGALGANGGKIIVPAGRYAFRRGVKIENGLVLFEGEGPGAYAESSSSARGSALVNLTSGNTMFSFGEPRTHCQHVGPQFEHINFYNYAGTKTSVAVRIRLHSRWRFDACSFYNFFKGIEIVSDSSSRGGSISGGDASWGWVGHCFLNKNQYGIYQTHSGGFTVVGCAFCATENNTNPSVEGTGIYTNGGGQLRVFANKFDQGIALDHGGIGCEVWGNQIEDYGPHGIVIRRRSTGGIDSGQKNTIGPNFFTGNGSSGAESYAILIESGASETLLFPQRWHSVPTGKRINNLSTTTDAVTTTRLAPGQVN